MFRHKKCDSAECRTCALGRFGRGLRAFTKALAPLRAHQILVFHSFISPRSEHQREQLEKSASALKTYLDTYIETTLQEKNAVFAR